MMSLKWLEVPIGSLTNNSDFVALHVIQVFCTYPTKFFLNRQTLPKGLCTQHRLQKEQALLE